MLFRLFKNKVVWCVAALLVIFVLFMEISIYTSIKKTENRILRDPKFLTHPHDIIVSFGGYIGRSRVEKLAKSIPDNTHMRRVLKIYSNGEVMSVLQEQASADINSRHRQIYLDYIILRNQFYK